MKIKSLLLISGSVLLVLVGLQIATFYLFARPALKDFLLTDSFGQYSDIPDTIFVRDFQATDCRTGDTFTEYSHRLINDQEFLRSRMGDRKFVYQRQEEYNPFESPEKNFDFRYETFVKLWPTDINNLFTAEQTEVIVFNHSFDQKDVRFVWLLFYWHKYYENNHSTQFLKSDVFNK